MSKLECYLTVGIPVYNGEKYISRCLDSILEQKNIVIEIIVALDKSIDNSEVILNRYQADYSNIKIIAKTEQDKGPGKSRNILMDIAKTEYIYFIDIDDYLSHENVLEQYMERIMYDKTDILIGSHKHSDNPENGLFLKNEVLVLCDETRKKLFLEYSYSLTYTWNKIYRLSWLKKNNIKNRYEVAEDLHLFAKCFVNAINLSTSKEVGLIYETGNMYSITNSVMYKITEEKLNNYVLMGHQLELELDYSKKFDRLYLFSYVLWLQTIILRDGLRTGSLTFSKAMSYLRQSIRIERKLPIRQRLVCEFQLNFKKYLMLRYLLP